MAARPIWRGQIRLALVSIPVELYPATKSGASISFHQVHEPSGKRIRYEKVVPGIGPVDRDEIMKGYEVSKGHYVLLDPEEIEKVKLESKKTLDLVQFVDVGDIDAMYYEKPYYVIPADDLAEDAFVVLRDALRKSKKVGVGQLAMRGQEYVVALKPCGKGLLLETLRYADEVHKANSYFREIEDKKPDDDMLDLASMLIEKRTADFDPKEFHNRYVDALRDLIKEKQKRKGEKVIQEDEEEAVPKGSNVIDLMAALKKSLESGGGDTGKGKAKSKAKPAPRSKARPSSSGTKKKAAAGGRK
jgi:DNA end-binding protein Ku